jgi:hypothetical protein
MSDQQDQTPEAAEQLSGGLRFVGWLLIGGAALLPWLQRLFDVGLLSDYYRTVADPLASGVAMLAFVIAHQGYKGRSKERLQKLLWWWGGSVVLCFAACFLLLNTVGETFDPGPWLQDLIRLGWQGIYIFLFASLAVFLCVIALLYAPKKPRAPRAPAAGS